jgi:hypothetical protein
MDLVYLLQLKQDERITQSNKIQTISICLEIPTYFIAASLTILHHTKEPIICALANLHQTQKAGVSSVMR